MSSKNSRETDGQQRRILLQGALATCCAFALSALSGCGKREEPASTAPAGDTAPPPTAQPDTQSAPPAAAEGSGKLAKVQVQYQEQPNGEQQCSRCQHFVAASNTCNLVEGPINPEGWCTLWVLKEG